MPSSSRAESCLADAETVHIVAVDKSNSCAIPFTRHIWSSRSRVGGTEVQTDEPASDLQCGHNEWNYHEVLGFRVLGQLMPGSGGP